MTEPRTPPRWLARTVAALLAVLFVAHVATRDDGIRWNGDAAQYLMHAENLAAGAPYARTGWLVNTERSLTPPAYPPGYPLALTPVVAATGRARAPIAALQALFLAALTGLFAALFWRRLAPASVVLLVLLVGLSPFFVGMVSRGLSDVLFGALVAATLLAFDRAQRATPRRRVWAWALAAGVLAGAAILTRSLGVALLPTFVIAALLPGRRASLGPAVAAVALAVALAAGVTSGVDWRDGAQILTTEAAETGYGEMVRQGLIGRAERIPRFVVERATQYVLSDRSHFWNSLLLPGLGHVPIRAAGLLLIVAGIWASVRDVRAVDVFAVVYVAALLPWSFGWARYLLPVLPVFYAYLLLGGETLWRRARPGGPRLGAGVAIGICALALGAYAFEGVALMADRVASGPSTPDDGSELVRQHVPEAALLLTESDPRRFILTTGRTAATVPYDTTAWNAYAGRLGATHMLVVDDRDAIAAWAPRLGWQRVAGSEAADLYATPVGAPAGEPRPEAAP
ncbi:MAG: glycosyltransferase family 39 protein [Bacteroidota bacterium]